MIGYKARHACRVKISSEAAELQPGLEKAGGFGCELRGALRIADLFGKWVRTSYSSQC